MTEGAAEVTHQWGTSVLGDDRREGGTLRQVCRLSSATSKGPPFRQGMGLGVRLTVGVGAR